MKRTKVAVRTQDAPLPKKKKSRTSDLDAGGTSDGTQETNSHTEVSRLKLAGK